MAQTPLPTVGSKPVAYLDLILPVIIIVIIIININAFAHYLVDIMQ